MAIEVFEATSLTGLDEPVRRYFEHAITRNATLRSRVRLSMDGRIKIGSWLPFTATQTLSGNSLRWVARVGWRALAPLTVEDNYRDGQAFSEGRLLGRMRVFHTDGIDIARSAAGRVALEASIWTPANLLPQHGVSWRAESDELIVASWEIGPERVRVRIRIDQTGAVRETSALRWGKPPGADRYDYLPCGAHVHAERRFEDLLVPTRVSAGWFFGTARYTPFFIATVRELSQL